MQALAHRSGWLQHPGRGAIESLAASHDAFLAAATDFVARLAWIGQPERSARLRSRQAAQLAPRFRDWQWGMTCHERFEEQRLVPLLKHRAGVDVSELAAEHAHLHGLAERCLTSFERLAAELAAGRSVDLPVERARADLSEYATALQRHLESEEKRMFPALLRIGADDGELVASCGSR